MDSTDSTQASGGAGVRADGGMRMEWLDGFRGVAVVAMIWVHAANTFLRLDLKGTEWFEAWTFYHGLVAPAFFWIGGYARGVRGGGGRRPGWATARRLLAVMGLGYALRLPVGPLLDGDWERAWLEAVKVDVLQVLAFTGLLMVGVERWAGALALRRWLMGGLTVVFVLLEPAAANWETGRPAVDAWLNRNSGSVFCLFPWAGFGLAGWLCGSWMAGLSGKGRGVAAGLAGLLVWGMPWAGGQAAFFLERLGWVVLLALAAERLLPLLRGRGGAWLKLAGRESLVMYAAHLAMIHVVPAPRVPLERAIGGTQSLAQVAGWFMLLTAGSGVLAWLNERRKRGA